MSKQSHVFGDYDQADRFAEAREADGFAEVAIFTNSPRPGQWTVVWGDNEKEDTSFDGLMAAYGRMFAERDADAAAQDEERYAYAGRHEAARSAAKDAGLAGRDAEVFEAGFCGISAKFANPRVEGREAVFRAGRAAWADPRWQREFRAASARARPTLEKVVEPYAEGYSSCAEGY